MKSIFYDQLFILTFQARREKISDRMKLLQSLVPGCDKVNILPLFLFLFLPPFPFPFISNGQQEKKPFLEKLKSFLLEKSLITH